VRPMSVVMLHVVGQDPLKVSGADNQQVVGHFGSYAAHPSLGDGVRHRSPKGNPDDLGPLGPPDFVEGRPNLASLSRTTKRTTTSASRMAMLTLRACWVTQSRVGLEVTPPSHTCGSDGR
jgi:hypothetical protein